MSAIKTVLVIDDSRLSRIMSTRFILSKHSAWRVDGAESAEEALARASTECPYLILLDVNMPGMGGLAAAPLLQQAHPEAHIVLLTANVQDATRRRADELGIGFLEKPILEKSIHQLLDRLEGVA